MSTQLYSPILLRIRYSYTTTKRFSKNMQFGSSLILVYLLITSNISF